MPIYAYTTLDDPLGPLGTSAQGINTSGQIAGYYLDSSNSSHGFLYSGGTYTTLDDPLAATVAGGGPDHPVFSGRDLQIPRLPL